MFRLIFYHIIINIRANQGISSHKKMYNLSNTFVNKNYISYIFFGIVISIGI
jgi:hypothetical protein